MVDVNDCSADLCWKMLQSLPGAEIVRCRAISKFWRTIVDDTNQTQWRHMFDERVCAGLRMRNSFDWKKAVVAASHKNSINALCIWNDLHVRLATPWYSNESVILRTGIVRLRSRSVYHTVIDFVYDDAFRLRCMPRTCVQRNDESPCRNCRTRSKQRCLQLQYDYYIRPVSDEDEEMLNEHLIRRLVPSIAH